MNILLDFLIKTSNQNSNQVIQGLRVGFLAILMLGSLSQSALADLTITPTTNAGTIGTQLTGENVTISNVTINQGSGTFGTQTGVFSGGDTGTAGPLLGIANGVVMVTGTVRSADGANRSTSRTTGGEPGPTSPLLNTITPGDQYDTVTLQFNVIPTGNTLSLDYVFGSEEYNEYVCTIYNDAVGIFVSGPGIPGDVNIARIDQNSANFSINQINRGTPGYISTINPAEAAPCDLNNSQFFVNNIDNYVESPGDTSTTIQSNYTNVEYDGLTKPLAATLSVQPNQTYTIKVVIADIGDFQWDGAVFLDLVRSYNLDYGDAPNSYSTTSVNQAIQLPGPARHSVDLNPLVYLGSVPPDVEGNGISATAPNAANGDDNTGDDEDVFGDTLKIPSGITSHTIPNIPVHNTSGKTAKLMGWIDFNQDGDFLDTGEQATVDVAANQATANLSWSGFTSLNTGNTYARFRITTDTNLINSPSSEGLAIDGEVEDYQVAIAHYDFGDAPDAGSGTGAGNYQTTLSDGGAAQAKITTSGQVLSLGSNIDSDNGSLQNSAANADDNNGSPDDEDGVATFPVLTTLDAQTYVVPVSVSNNVSDAYLVGYIDFNQDGDFDDSGEKSTTVTVPSSNTNSRTFNVTFTTPAGMTTGNTYARFRLGQVQATAESSIGVSGNTDYGEIEDYQIAIAPTPAVLTNTSSSCPSPKTLISSPNFTLNSANYALNSPLQTSLPLTLYNGSTKFNATLSGTGTWSGGVQLRNDPSFGNHIFLQPQNTDGYLTSGNKATYEFSWQTAVSNFSMVVGGLNSYDGTTITASYQGNLVPISAANFSNLSTGMTLSDTNIDTDNQVDTVVSSNTTGGTEVTNNFYTLSIPGPIDKITVVSGKEINGYVSTATIGFALIGYCGNIDYGDAPDTYGTNSTNNNSEGVGANHLIVDTLKLGSNAPDPETDAQTPLNATGDGTDEDGIGTFPSLSNNDTSYSVAATVTNNTGSAANVYAWLDFDRDGKFDGDERATVSNGIGNGSINLDGNGKVPTGSNGTVTLTWNNLGSSGTNIIGGNSYARIRLTTDNLAVATATTTRDPASIGNATNGEVEDYPIAIAYRANPDLPANFCQLPARNLLFILDDSSSVAPAEETKQRYAVMATLNDFVAKNLTGQAAIVGFDSLGRTVINYTNITAANLPLFEAALTNNYGVPGQGTNWEAGFQAGLALPGGIQPNAVFFFTDGVNNGGTNNSGGSPEDEANQFKNAGAHIYGIGIELTINNGFRGITDGNNTTSYPDSNIYEADYLDIDSYDTLKDQYTNAFLKNLCPADFGDAPDTYGTDNIANSITNPLGANHAIVSGLFLGAKAPDADANGFVDGMDNNNGNAIDDDAPVGTGTGTGNGDDEGNFTFPTLNAGKKSYTIPASNVTTTNTTGQPAKLHVWIDFNKNGTFETTEYASAIVGTSSSNPQTNLTWTGISVGTLGNTYARFRLTSDNNINNSTPGGNASDGEVEDYQVAIAQASDPNLLLVKRITAINPGQPGGTQFNNFVDDTGTTNDNNFKWPDSDGNFRNSTNNFLRGEISVPQVKPGDEVEYTIYFLSNGDVAAKDVKICDVVPDHMTFVKNTYGVELGIGLGFDPTAIPVIPNLKLSNLLNDDQGDFYAPNTTPPANLCKEVSPSNTLINVNGTNNDTGAVVVELGDLPRAIGAGNPTNSYGFIRFRGKVK